MNTGEPLALSRVTLKYISLSIEIFCTRYTLLTGRPSAPDCLVTRWLPRYSLASAAAYSGVSANLTPP